MDNKKPQQSQKGPAAPQHNKGQPASPNRPQQSAPQGKQQPAQPKKSGCCW